MSEVKSVTLTGGGATGLRGAAAMAAAVPRVVKLGAVLRPAAARQQLVRLETFLDVLKSTPPKTVRYDAKAMASLSRMYLNDQEGDCVIAGKYHLIGMWSGNDGGATVVVGDSTVQKMYNLLKAGPGDSGCIITDVLDYWMSTGLDVPEGKNRIDGYAAFDWTNKDVAKAAIFLFGATIGFAIPQDWLNNSRWDVTNSPIVGGHDVSPIGYDDEGVYVSSWGNIYLMTWAAFTSTRYLSEAYVSCDKYWYNDDKVAPNGVNVDALRSALDSFKNNRIPDWNSPPPPVPIPPAPVPPSPPVPIPPAPPAPPPAPLVFPSYSGKVDPLTWKVILAPVAGADAKRLSWQEFKDWCQQVEQKLAAYFTPEKVAEIMAFIGSEYVQGKDWKEIVVDVIVKFAVPS